MRLPTPRLVLALASVVVVGSFALLVALRLNSAPSQEPLLFARSLSVQTYPNIERGQTITAGHGEYLEYRFTDGAGIFLDPDTVVRLDETEPNNEVTLIQGRLVVKNGAVNVKARNLSLAASNCVLVHYSWLDLMDVTPLTAGGCQFVDNTPSILAGMTTKFSTVDAAIKGVSDFTPLKSSAKEFFDWAGITAAPQPVPVVEW